MADKNLFEIRFIETDDGFRVEFKGDKERMRQMGGPCGFGQGKRFWGGMWRGGGRHHHGHRHHGPGPGFGPGPWSWWCWDEEVFEEDESEEPPKDV